MENLNKLEFTKYKVNEKSIYIPIENIKQQYDESRFCKKYLFKVICVSKYIKKENSFTMYLAPVKGMKLPIVKATIPFEIIRTKKIIPSYEEGKLLEDHDLFILNERKFRKISELNESSFNKSKLNQYYILAYGYLVNKYKDDDAMTKVKEGVQEFRLISKPKQKFIDRNYATSCYVTNSRKKLFEVMKIKPIDLEFEDIPDNFYTK